MPKISILILTYNSKADIIPLFNSLFAKFNSQILKGEYEIIILDNNSSDQTLNEVKNYFKDKNDLFEENSKDSKKPVRFLKSSENLGYAKGINKAASYAKGDILVIINPDAELVEADFEKIIEEFLKRTKMAILGLHIVDYKGTSEKTEGKFYNPLTFILFALGLENIFSLRFSSKIRTKVSFVSGGFMALRRELFVKIGGYDNEYFMYIEDMDICYRFKKMGYEIWYAPYATIKHRGQGSSNREFAIVNIYKGLQTFYEKHGSFFELLYIKNLLTIKAAIIIFLGSIIGKKEIVKIYTKALKTIV